MIAASLLDKSRIEIKLGGFGLAPATALGDPTIHPRVQHYRRQTGAAMIPLDAGDITRKIPAADYHVSRKVDGEFNALAYRDGTAFTINPGGTVRVGMPWLDEAARLLSQAGVREAIIPGELYVASTSDRRPRVHDVSKIGRQPQSDDDLKRLRFAAFDIISWNGQSVDEPFAETWKRIVATFGAGDRVHPVEARNASDCSAIAKIYGEWVEEEGAEGLVVRSDTAGRFKIKPRHTLDAAVIGFTESTDDRQGMMHDLLLAVMREDETLQVLSRVGGGFSDELRRDMLSDLKDMVVESEYAEVNSDHVAYLMVQPEWVVEISCLDLVSQTTRGGSVNRMVLDWNRRDDRYDVIRRLPLASVISPQFVRRREDKSVNVADIRVQQIADLVEIPLLERSAREMTLPKSEVLQREVYVKQQKGETMVRKFVMWQTHKAQESEYFPDYVVHYTDFSPNRKVPLARDIRVSSSREQIDSLWEEFKEANIKKGWEAYVGTNKELAVPEPVPSVASEAPPSDLPNQKATKKPASPRQSPEKKAGGKKVTKSDSTDTQPPNSESSQPTAKKAANKRAATTSVTKNKAAKKPVKKAVKKATPKPKKKSD